MTNWDLDAIEARATQTDDITLWWGVLTREGNGDVCYAAEKLVGLLRDAREDIPPLVVEVRALRAEVERLWRGR